MHRAKGADVVEEKMDEDGSNDVKDAIFFWSLLKSYVRSYLWKS